MENNFITDIVDRDIENNNLERIKTRFPPEPNGYLHIGHAKAIFIDFGIAKRYNGTCNLRFDDTNPTKEETEYVHSILEDIKWLGYTPDNIFYASDYFDRLYEYALILIDKGVLYVDECSADRIREMRGTLTQPGENSPYRDRPIAENRMLFEQMKEGKFENGQMVLRAKIDMSSPNLNMRDPVVYRILKQEHIRSGNKWCIYPMYDYAHPLSDAIEGITHSLCTVEFESHRPLYDWFLQQLEWKQPPRQTEFARLNLNYTLTSKRKCAELVRTGKVSGWDDPRMSTLSALRRRGFPKEAIADFCARIGVSKSESVVDMALLEHCVREYLNQHAERVMAVLRPIKLIIDNMDEDWHEMLDVEINPQDPQAGTRQISFSREMYIEENDFMETPVKKYFRLSPGKEVRLKSAYVVKCESWVKDEDGKVIEVHVTYDPQSRGGATADGRKVKGTIHWVNAKDCLDAEIRLYDRLFLAENPDGEQDINPDSKIVLENGKVEKYLESSKPTSTYQFLRNGYFTTDSDSKEGHLVFNQTVTLKDSFKI